VTAKEYLSQAYRIDQRINIKLRQASRLREIAEKATSVTGKEKVKGTRRKSPMEDAVVKVIDLENEINDDIDRLIDLKRGITDAIKKLKIPAHQMVLEMRYLEYKSWEEIAEVMNFDVRWVYRLHKRALKEVEDNLPDH